MARAGFIRLYARISPLANGCHSRRTLRDELRTRSNFLDSESLVIPTCGVTNL